MVLTYDNGRFHHNARRESTENRLFRFSLVVWEVSHRHSAYTVLVSFSDGFLLCPATKLTIVSIYHLLLAVLNFLLEALLVPETAVVSKLQFRKGRVLLTCAEGSFMRRLRMSYRIPSRPSGCRGTCRSPLREWS